MAGQQRTTGVIVDDAAFQAGLKQAVARLKLDTEADLVRFGQRAVRSMRQLCAVDTGRLRGSIGVSQGRDARGLFLDIGTSVDYALPVEYGTRYQAAQPFVRPGLAEAAAQGLR